MKSYLSIKNVYLYVVSLLLLFSTVSCSDSLSTDSNKKNKSIVGSAKMESRYIVKEPLFTLVQRQKVSIPNKQQSYLTSIKNRQSTKKVVLAKLTSNPSSILQSGETIAIPVGSNRKIIVVGREVTHSNSKREIVSWAGSLRNKRGQAALTLTKKGITGMVETGSMIYSFVPIGENMQAIIHINRSKLPYGCGLVDTGSSQHINIKINKRKSTSLLVNPKVIDVLVLYTTSVKNKTGDIIGRVNTAITNTNMSYVNSNLSLDMRLKQTVEINYNAHGQSYLQLLQAMKNPSDGNMDMIPSLRNQYLADIVVLLVENSYQGVIGRAYEILATGPTAFAVSQYYYATLTHTFAHEIGHLQGAEHNVQEASNNPPFQYGHGYIDPNGNWRTIMAYPTGCISCPRVLYWSNPNVNYPPTGQPMGTAATEDNARVLFNTIYYIRDFKTLPSPYNTSITNKNASGQHPNLTWDEDPDADQYYIYRCKSSFGYSEPCFVRVGSTTRAMGDINQWQDNSVTMVDPYQYPSPGDCTKWAYYYVTAFNRTGESYYRSVNGTCIKLE